MIGTSIGSKQNVHERGDVGIVARVAFAVVMPMVKFRGADQHSKRPDAKAHIGMNVDRPNAAKNKEADQRFQRETDDHGGQIDESQSVNGVERMLAVSGEPIETFGAMVDRMEPP